MTKVFISSHTRVFNWLSAEILKYFFSSLIKEFFFDGRNGKGVLFSSYQGSQLVFCHVVCVELGICDLFLLLRRWQKLESGTQFGFL